MEFAALVFRPYTAIDCFSRYEDSLPRALMWSAGSSFFFSSVVQILFRSGAVSLSTSCVASGVGCLAVVIHYFVREFLNRTSWEPAPITRWVVEAVIVMPTTLAVCSLVLPVTMSALWGSIIATTISVARSCLMACCRKKRVDKKTAVASE